MLTRFFSLLTFFHLCECPKKIYNIELRAGKIHLLTPMNTVKNLKSRKVSAVKTITWIHVKSYLWTEIWLNTTKKKWYSHELSRVELTWSVEQSHTQTENIHIQQPTTTPISDKVLQHTTKWKSSDPTTILFTINNNSVSDFLTWFIFYTYNFLLKT